MVLELAPPFSQMNLCSIHFHKNAEQKAATFSIYAGGDGNGSNQAAGCHQAVGLPSNTGLPLKFMGSTPGPSYTEQAFSSLQVTWSVRLDCANLDINTVSKWCEVNLFEEDHAHGVRKLVTDARLLAPNQWGCLLFTYNFKVFV